MRIALLFIVLVALVFRLGAVPHWTESTDGRGIILVESKASWDVATASDGSFRLFFTAGCVPLMRCSINEPTDWEAADW